MSLTTTMTNQGVNPPIKVNSNPIYGQNAQFIDFIVPANGIYCVSFNHITYPSGFCG